MSLPRSRHLSNLFAFLSRFALANAGKSYWTKWRQAMRLASLCSQERDNTNTTRHETGNQEQRKLAHTTQALC